MTTVRDVSVVATGLHFTEGPAFDHDGRLHIVEVAAGRIVAIDVTNGSTAVVATPGGGPTGLTFGTDGLLYVANNGGIVWDGTRTDGGDEGGYGRVERIEEDGSVTELYLGVGSRRFLGPNDLVCDEAGGLWFTDPGHGEIAEERGRLCYATRDGSTIVDLVEDYRFPNGLALRNEDTELIVAETGSGYLWLHDVLEPGVLSPRRPFGRLPKGHRPDGICVDEAGYVLAAGTFGGSVVVFDPDGRHVESVAVPDKLVTNVAFHPTEHLVYVTQARAGTVVSFLWDRAGARLAGAAR